jgi:hypothetical protein
MHITRWTQAGFQNSLGTKWVTFPFVEGFTQGQDHVVLSQVGRPAWYIVFAHDVADPSDPSYPRYVEIHDNDDFASFNLQPSASPGWTSLSGGLGPVPPTKGKRHVKFVLLDRDRKPLLSQSGDYYVDPG